MRKNVKIEGGYSDPKITDVLFFKLIFLPYSIFMWFYFYIRYPINAISIILNLIYQMDLQIYHNEA